MIFKLTIPEFKDSAMFCAYKPNTVRQYNTAFNRVLPIIGDVDITTYSTADFNDLYELMIEESGVTYANTVRNALRKFFEWCVDCEYVSSNPVTQVNRKRVGDKHTVTVPNIRSFLTAAYSEFNWRNVGIIVHLSFETGEYVTDLLDAEWDRVDLETGVYTSDRYTIQLSKDFVEMLKVQHDDYGFQRYIAPSPYLSKGEFRHYSVNGFSKVVNRIRKEAGISSNFRTSDIRRTGMVARLQQGEDMEVVVDILKPTNKAKLRYNLKKLMQELTPA